MEATLEADPEAINDEQDVFEIICDPAQLVSVRTAVQEAGIDYDSADIAFQPSFTSPIAEADVARKLYKILDALDDCDDVQDVYSNEELSDEVEAQLEED